MVLPQLTPDVGAEPTVGAPPPAFRPLCNQPLHVRIGGHSVFNGPGLTSAQKNGLRYEAKAQVYLRDWFQTHTDFTYLLQPHITFDNGPRPRTIIPDGLALEPNGLVTIFEVKSQHMPEAWWQLRRLYEPVVRNLSFVRSTSCVEVVRSYDPAMGFPELVETFSDPAQLLRAPRSLFKVLIWRPR